jgi:uncharacterized Zn finger protein (UPF0148 family)
MENPTIINMTMTGEHICAKCGITLYNDHGWHMSDGTVICRNTLHCSRRRYQKEEEAAKANGTYKKPRWR